MLPFSSTVLLCRPVHNHKCSTWHKHTVSNLHLQSLSLTTESLCLATFWCSDVSDWVLLLLLDQILLWAFWVCSSWNRKPTSLEGGKRPWKGKIRQKMLHALRDLKMHLFFLFFLYPSIYLYIYLSIYRYRDISLYLLSIYLSPPRDDFFYSQWD